MRQQFVIQSGEILVHFRFFSPLKNFFLDEGSDDQVVVDQHSDDE